MSSSNRSGVSCQFACYVLDRLGERRVVQQFEKQSLRLVTGAQIPGQSVNHYIFLSKTRK